MHSGIIQLFLVMGIIVLLIRKGVGIGWSMMAGAVLNGILFSFGKAEWGMLFGNTITDPKMLVVVIVLQLVLVLEKLLNSSGRLDLMAEKTRGALADHRLSVLFMPALIGLLPSAGGARFSAPLVDKMLAGMDVASDAKSFINFWFRHLWEYVSPVYPGILLASSFLEVPPASFIVYMLPYPVLMIAAGWFTVSGQAGGVKTGGSVYVESSLNGSANGSAGRSCRTVMFAVLSLWPILATVFLSLLPGLSVSTALVVVIVLILLVDRTGAGSIARIVRNAFNIKMVLLIVGVFLFKESLETGRVIDGMLVAAGSMPQVVLLFLLPFSMGLMTGITVAFVGICFPVIIGLYGAVPPPEAMVMPFVAGFGGVMLSPVHLCLVLTNEFFESDILRVYKRLIPPSLLLMVFAVVFHLLVTG